MQVTEEIKKYFKKNGIKQVNVAESLGVKTSFVSELFSGKRTIGAETALKLNKAYGFDTKWLMTGAGTMFKIDATAQSVAEAEQKQAERNSDVVMVPVINLDARGGFLANNTTDVAEYVSELVPFSLGVAQPNDAVIPMYGDSMYPRYPSGSRLLIRQVETWREYLELGACYVIELTDLRRVVKIVKKGSDSDHFSLVSVNPEFEEQEIPKSLINRVFLVKMMLKSETV